jgi:hypothetical protein
MKITIDFDGTLSTPKIQSLVMSLYKYDIDIWILTSRYDELHKHLYPQNPSNEDMYSVVLSMGIPKHKIIFTNASPKANYLKSTNVVVHIDDNNMELFKINNHTLTIGLPVGDNDLFAKIMSYL